MDKVRELLRLLSRHPYADIRVITSRQNAGKDIAEIFPRLAGTGLSFSMPDVEAIKSGCDAAFLALPHGLAHEFAEPFINAGLTVIDISADFRLRSLDQYKKYYKIDHPAPGLLSSAVYGLPERYREQIRTAKLIACPGCYVTSILLPTTAVLAAKLASPEGIVACSMSGVTGAGRKVDLPYIFPECNESVRAYGVSGHRHLPEIEQELAVAAGLPSLSMNFIPHLVPTNRGIQSTVILDAAEGCTEEAVADRGSRGGRVREGVRERTVRARAPRRKAPGHEARHAHELLRDRVQAGLPHRKAPALLLHRQPHQGRVGPGCAGLQHPLRVPRGDRAGLRTSRPLRNAAGPEFFSGPAFFCVFSGAEIDFSAG